jgi:hypothetical protein
MPSTSKNITTINASVKQWLSGTDKKPCLRVIKSWRPECFIEI